jgi:hypothetical protein
MGGSILRPEARPLNLEALTQQQREAVGFVVDLLEKAQAQLEKIQDKEELPELDPRRSSRIIFMTGEPGTGKSTVYTSLRSEMEDEKEDKKRSLEKTGTTEKEKETRELRRRILKLGEDITWLEPLDLEPLAESSNFLAAVLVRIERALEPFSVKREGKQHSQSLLDPRSDSQDGWMKLQSLQKDIALTWDGNTKSRVGQVDPDTYASEVIRAERARMALNKRFQEALSNLPAANSKRSDRRRLFLLVVDDLYMNPEISIALLRMLRMISSPQLFVLLLGDYDTTEFLYYQQAIGNYIRLAGDVVYQRNKHSRDQMLTRAWALTAGSLRKLVPPKHRFELEPLDIKAAREFKPLKDPGSENAYPTLEELLAKFPLVKEKRPASLADLLGVTWTWRESQSAKKVDRLLETPYTGTQLLEMPPRHATDLWMTLKGEGGVGDIGMADDERTIDICARELDSSLSEQSRLSDDIQRGLRDSIQRSNLLADRMLDTSRLRARLDERRKERKFSTPKIFEIKVFTRVAWDLWLLAQPNHEESKEKVEFIPRPTGWLVVFHDVLALLRKNNLTDGSLVSHQGISGGSIKAPDQEPSGSAVVGPRTTWMRVCWQDQRSESWIDCYSPAWETFWEFDMLCSAWNSLGEGAGSKEPSWESYMFRWVDAISEILAKRGKFELTWLENPSKPPSDEDWKALAGRVAQLAKEEDPITSDWLTHLGYLVRARAGVPDAGANRFERQEDLKAFWRVKMKERDHAPENRVLAQRISKGRTSSASAAGRGSRRQQT